MLRLIPLAATLLLVALVLGCDDEPRYQISAPSYYTDVVVRVDTQTGEVCWILRDYSEVVVDVCGGAVNNGQH